MFRRAILTFALLGIAAFATASDPHAHVLDVNQMIEAKMQEAEELSSPTAQAVELISEETPPDVMPPIADKEKGGLRLSIEPADVAGSSSTTLFLARLDRVGPPAGEKIGNASIMWTTPGGERATVALREVESGHWASLVDLGSNEGHHRLVLLMTFESASSDIEKLVEEIYDFELPNAILTPRNQRELGEHAPAIEELAAAPLELGSMAAAQAKNHAPAHPLTFGSVALPFLYLNVFIIMMLAIGVIALRRTPEPVKHILARQIARLPGMDEGGPRLRDVLTEAGLVDPLPVAPPRAKRLKTPRGKGKVIQAATIDESQIERSVVEEEEELPARAASPAVMDAGKKTQMLIERLKEKQSGGNNEATRVEEGGGTEEIEPRGSKGKADEELSVDLNDLAF